MYRAIQYAFDNAGKHEMWTRDEHLILEEISNQRLTNTIGLGLH